MAKFYYQGHGSFRLTANDGTVIYVDPYAGDGYDKPADYILVTHQHGDHNMVNLCAKKPDCEIITNADALDGGVHQTIHMDDITAEAVEASNKNHSPEECVGYIITIDGKKLYASGDTSKTSKMAELADMGLDWAVFPCDGIYNMSLEEAAESARIVKAKHNIPIHMKPGELFDMDMAKAWTAPDKVIVEPGREIEL